MPVRSYGYPRRVRLSGRLAFAAVYERGAKHSRGPLTAFSAPNQLKHCRWGFSVSRRVGTAVRRNRIKRLLRESIRLSPNELPGGYDVVIVVRPHEPLALGQYQSLVSQLLIKIRDRWNTIK
ncbi:MAG: ribonuclease P protein component [Tepidisphaeraceae bacterium]|jgi:ribonuclease P protein component